MAQQRKSPPTRKPSAAGRSTANAASKSSSTKTAAKPAVQKSAAGRKPPPRKGKSIVNQKQTPWGMIASTVAVVVFAAAVVVVAIATHKSSNDAGGGASCSQMIGSAKYSYLTENKCASEIKDVTFKKEPGRTHVDGSVKYDSTPPVGGNHNPFWADCAGTVYSKAIANENAVHMLEHGAIWITYNASKLDAKQVQELSGYVSGVDRMAMSPYPNLKSPISLQAWGYQLFLTSPSDPRIAKFISALKYNQKTTPEPNSSCSNPTFKSHPSTFGHPISS